MTGLQCGIGGAALVVLRWTSSWPCVRGELEMQAAPPVEIRVGSGRRERVALVVVWILAGLTLGAWVAAVREEFFVFGIGAGLTCVLAGFLVRPQQGWLAWDGQAWVWRSASAVPAVPAPGLRVALDLGVWVLVRDDAARWCGIARSESAAQWHGLRLALHASQRATRQVRS